MKTLVTATKSCDGLDRPTQGSNPLGTFVSGYGAGNYTGRPDTLTYPNGQTTAFSVYGNTGTANAGRLETIDHRTGAGAVLSKFDYGYDAAGQITQWTRQLGSTSAAVSTYDFGYDRASQLVDATLKNGAGVTLKTFSFQYDAAGNLLRQSVDAASKYQHYNALNQLEQVGGGGKTVVEGRVDEPAVVQVNGQPATLTSGPGSGEYQFQREIELQEGSNTVTVQATDASGNTRANSYTINVGGVERTLNYDLNGNLLSDGEKTYEWDAADRLMAINYTGTARRSEFTYDGLSRRVKSWRKTGRR